jgi:hypothetical protein
VIDVHSHLDLSSMAGSGRSGPPAVAAALAGAVQAALASMGQYGVATSIVMPPPTPDDYGRPYYDSAELATAVGSARG